MKRIRRSFKYVFTLEHFFNEQSLNLERFMASLDVPQRVEFRDILKLLVAYNVKYEGRSVEVHEPIPYLIWINSVFSTKSCGALSRPSHDSHTLSSSSLASPLWVALDRELGRSVIEFLVVEACLLLPQPNCIDCYVQLTGDPIPYDRPLRSTCTNRSNNGIYVSKCRPLSPFERELIKQNRPGGPNKALPSQIQIPVDIITHIKFVVPLAFAHAFPPSKTKWIENYQKSESAQEYAEPIFHDLSPNLMALSSMLVQVGQRLESRILLNKFRAIGTRKTEAVPKHVVANFCCSSLRYLLPPETLGSRENWRLLETKIQQYIKLNGHSKLFIGKIMAGFKVTETWLGKTSSKQQSALDQKHFMQFIYWVFILVNEYLLRFFVIRQSGAGMGDIYLKVKGWREARRQKQTEFTQALTKIESPQTWQKLTAASSHVAPKTRPGAYRVLVNLSKFKPFLGSVNGVLKYHADQNSETVDIKSVAEVYPHIHKFIQDHAGDDFYAVRTDIQGCFDEANSSKVLELVKKLVSPGTFSPYYVRRVLAPLFTPWNRTIDTIGMRGSVKGQLLPENSRNQVFIEKSHKSHLVAGDSVFNKVERILKNLIVQVGQEYYLMDKGIPQGSSISTSLCDLLCQDFIRTQLPRFWASPDVLILRYVDDFLFITTNRLEADLFLRTITRSRGFPEYGISFSRAKTESNFGAGSVDNTTFLGIPVSWCGNKISIQPSLGLGSLTDAAKSTLKHSLVTSSRPLLSRAGRDLKPVCLKRLPADLAFFIDTKNWAFGDSAWVDVEKIISLKTLKLAAVFKAFAKVHKTPTVQFIQGVVRHSVRDICRLLVALDIELKVSRKIVYRFLRLLIKSSGIRTKGILKHGMDAWLNFFKGVKNV